MSTTFTVRDSFEQGSYYTRRSSVNLPDLCLLAVDSTSTGEVLVKLISACSTASMTLNTEQARALAAELLASADAVEAANGGNDGRRLDILAQSQFELLTLPRVNTKEVRGCLGALGLPSEQYRRD